jgi:DNA processing protein
VPSESPTYRSPDFDRLDIVALTMIDGFGPATARAHLARIRAAARPFDDGLPDGEMRRARARAIDRLTTASRIGARCLLDGDADYPEALHSLEQPPLVLWVMGDVDVVRGPQVVSIVGTRDCTSYGERVTREMARAFARSGVCVVSGMARGIDAGAHRAAMEAGGTTVAVLGTGVDVPYPTPHRALHEQIRKHGAVISEAPPGTKAVRGCFPRRNRLIAALGAATVVVEAGAQSGALITANLAMELGRTVGVVPGPIDSASSLGSNTLMRDGAHPLTSIADALALLGLDEVRPPGASPQDPVEQSIWEALGRPARDFDVLCARTGLPARICFETVTALELRGLVECTLTGELRRR